MANQFTDSQFVERTDPFPWGIQTVIWSTRGTHTNTFAIKHTHSLFVALRQKKKKSSFLSSQRASAERKLHGTFQGSQGHRLTRSGKTAPLLIKQIPNEVRLFVCVSVTFKTTALSLAIHSTSKQISYWRAVLTWAALIEGRKKVASFYLLWLLEKPRGEERVDVCARNPFPHGHKTMCLWKAAFRCARMCCVCLSESLRLRSSSRGRSRTDCTSCFDSRLSSGQSHCCTKSKKIQVQRRDEKKIWQLK